MPNLHLYLSTACFHEQADDDGGLHASCRKTCKYCDAPCSCPKHPGGAEQVITIAWVDQARDIARQLLRHYGDTLPLDLLHRIATDPGLFWLRGEEQPPGTWHPA
jgi:hypothetical protein